MRAWLIFNACSPACGPVEAVMYDAYLLYVSLVYIGVPAVVMVGGPIYWGIRKLRGES